MNLLIPMYGDGGDVWAKCLRYDFGVLGSSVGVVNSTNVWSTDQLFNRIYVNTIGGRAGGSGVTISSNVTLSAGNSLTLSGSGGYVVSGSSANFSSFWGDGNNVLNLNATQLLTGTVPSGRVSGVYSGVTGLGAQAQALNLNSHQINSVTDPTSAQDAATKNYVDSNSTVLDYKAPARLGTTAALPSNSYSNGSSGVGATITGLSIGTLTIDGATANVGDRVLVMNEATLANNGIYTVTANSSLVVFVLTRATDHDQPVEMSSGTLVVVTSGTVNGGTGVAGYGGTQPGTFLQSTSVSVVGTSAVAFVETSGLGEVTAGSGLTKSGNTLSVDSSSVPVKSGGKIRNSEIDSTLLTPSAANIAAGTLGNTVIASSVAASGVGAKTTCGDATTSCRMDITEDGRIIKVASTTIAGGGGGLSSVLVASATTTGGNVQTLAGPGVSTGTIVFDQAGMSVSSTGVVSVKNLTFVASTETYPSGTLAASSNAGPCFSASTATWTQGNNKAFFCFSGSAIQSAGGFAALSLLIDGQFPDGLTATKGVPLQTSGATGSDCQLLLADQERALSRDAQRLSHGPHQRKHAHGPEHGHLEHRRAVVSN
jgi:hypothetical protein